MAVLDLDRVLETTRRAVEAASRLAPGHAEEAFTDLAGKPSTLSGHRVVSNERAHEHVPAVIRASTGPSR